ncbi:MAG: multidrug transporter AcrB, partial [Sneathiella sp.]|uniref:efflux RND transporter permease subunit n=1 Tax=Sneathiella sp. TaxID=1964365 RepID=UPI000C6547F5
MKDITETHNTARYFTENRHIAWVLLIAVFMWGIYGYLSMPKAKDPAIQVRVASVVTSWPGADATKIEQLLTRPIEEQIALSSTLHPVSPTKFAVKSLTLPNLSIVQIQLEETLTDTKSAFNEIDLNLKALDLPEGAGPIQFNDGFGDTAAILMTVASPTENPVEISLRARDIKAAIDVARAQQPTNSATRRSLVVVMPRDIALTVPAQDMDLFKDYLVNKNDVTDAVSLNGAGFIGLDFSTTLTDSELTAELNAFLKEKLAQVSFHEDAWPAIVIDDPAQTEAKLLASPGGKYSYRELDNFTNLIIRNLQTIPLVTVVNSSGVVDERIYMEYSQDLLA